MIIWFVVIVALIVGMVWLVQSRHIVARPIRANGRAQPLSTSSNNAMRVVKSNATNISKKKMFMNAQMAASSPPCGTVCPLSRKRSREASQMRVFAAGEA